MKKEDTFKKPEPIKIDFKNLPELPKVEGYSLPKAPPVVRSSAKKEEEKREEAEAKLRSPFSLKDEFDLSTYSGRFRHQMSRINPM